MHRGWGIAFQVWMAASLGSCAPEVSQIIVIVDAEPGVREVARFVRVDVYGGARQDQLSTSAVGELERPLRSEPIAEPSAFWGTTRIALAPDAYDASRMYRVEVRVYDSGGELTPPIASTYVISGYVSGETRVLRLLLLDACVGIVCPPEQVCGPDASCRDPFTPPEDLPPDDRCSPALCDEGGDPACTCGTDAGMDADGGTDSGMDVDDAGTDADPGTDAGVDAGTTDTGTTDTGGVDGGPTDAGTDIGALDGGSACNGLGEACAPGGTCDGSECLEDPNVCVPSAVFECGGFAGASCPGERPECLYPSGASGGVCMTEAQRACVCSTSSGRTAFPACAE